LHFVFGNITVLWVPRFAHAQWQCSCLISLPRGIVDANCSNVILRSTFRHLACEHQKISERQSAIIECMHQTFRIADHLVQEATRRLSATLQKT